LVSLEVLATCKDRRSEPGNWFAPEKKIRAKTEPKDDGIIDLLLHHQEVHHGSQRGVNVATIGFGGDL
jgi:hypothetical protein